MKIRTFLIRSGMVLLSTVGIIVPVAVYSRPPEGYRVPSNTLFPIDKSIPARPIRMQLSLLMRAVGDMDANKDLELNQVQARHLLVLVAPHRDKTVIRDSEARRLHARIITAFSEQQVRWLQDYMAGFPPPIRSDAVVYNLSEQIAIDKFRNNYNPFTSPEAYPQFKALPPETRQRYMMRYEQRMAILKKFEIKAQKNILKIER